MAGTISVNQMPQYGDKTVLDKMKQATTTTPMTGNPTPEQSAGRPPQSQSQVPIGGNMGLPVPTVHQEMADDLAQKAWAAQAWQRMAMLPEAGAFTRMYAKAAMNAYEEAFMKMRRQTPYFS